MIRGTGRAGLKRWRAGIARLLGVVVLLASLLAPPFAEGASFGTAPISGAAVTAGAAADQEGGAPAAPSRRDGLVHAGTHCACQLADRLVTPEHTAPAAFSAVVHLDPAARSLASLGAEPPARPPRA